MTLAMFVMLLTFGSAAAVILTEAIKVASYDKFSANLIALIVSITVGCIGTICFYILKDIPFNIDNIICMAFMTLCIWVGSMVGYDKVMQLVKQLGK